MNYQAYGKTDVGMVREKNDDNFFVDEERGLFAVADGLGGLPHGEVASKIAVEKFQEKALGYRNDSGINFQPLFEEIQDAVNGEGERLGTDFGIATTLTAMELLGDKIRIGHVGDSGILHIHGKHITQLTRDHTMANDMLEEAQKGEQPYIPEYYHHILQSCIGTDTDLRVEVVEATVDRGDWLVLYTDGLTKAFSIEEIQAIVRDSFDPEEAVEKLVYGANKRGGDDNITAVCVAFYG